MDDGRIDAAEAQVEALQAELATVRADVGTHCAVAGGQPASAAGMAAGGVIGATLGQASPVAADDPDDVELGALNESADETRIKSTGEKRGPRRRGDHRERGGSHRYEQRLRRGSAGSQHRKWVGVDCSPRRIGGWRLRRDRRGAYPGRHRRAGVDGRGRHRRERLGLVHQQRRGPQRARPVARRGHPVSAYGERHGAVVAAHLSSASNNLSATASSQASFPPVPTQQVRSCMTARTCSSAPCRARPAPGRPSAAQTSRRTTPTTSSWAPSTNRPR